MKAIFTFLIVLMLASCNQSNQSAERESSNSGEEFPDVDLWLTITDSIGVDYGDTNLVFGMLAVAVRIPEDRVAIMDIQKAKVSIFHNDGSFINTVGRQGSGPGEFLQPSWFSVTPSGGFVVSDYMAKKLIFYNSDLVYTGSMGSFFPSPPDRTLFLNDSMFVGTEIDYEMNDQGILAGFVVALWDTDSLEPEVFYFRDLALLDPANPFNSEATQPISTISPEGMVYTSVQSTDEYVIHGWNTDGSQLFTISESYTRVPKTQEEINYERETTRGFMSRAGIPDSWLDSFEPEPFHYAISSLGIAPDGNLWVGLGYYSHPVFSVYDPHSGEYLFTAALECPENKRKLSVIMNRWGFTALAPMPDSWPRVYLLEIEN